MKQRSQVNATAIFRVVVTATVDVKNDVRDGSDSGRRDDARNQPRDTLAEASLTDTVLSLNGKYVSRMMAARIVQVLSTTITMAMTPTTTLNTIATSQITLMTPAKTKSNTSQMSTSDALLEKVPTAGQTTDRQDVINKSAITYVTSVLLVVIAEMVIRFHVQLAVDSTVRPTIASDLGNLVKSKVDKKDLSPELYNLLAEPAVETECIYAFVGKYEFVVNHRYQAGFHCHQAAD
ncbi:hypothetical protein PInf_025028 [Phytophthora infestans]|nr:hypothetical protein PInf_025028 [Phytophthora infestans]